MEKTITEVNIDELIEIVNCRGLILFNDDVNSFDHVIECLIKYCNHGFIQALQCAEIIHNKGKYKVKSGTFDELHPILQAFCDNNLTAEIQ